MTVATLQKRVKGSSPRGEFEQSKTVALQTIEEKKKADRLKTERLRKARLEQNSK